MKELINNTLEQLVNGSITIEQANEILSNAFGINHNCSHENTEHQHIRCSVCLDCGEIIETDV